MNTVTTRHPSASGPIVYSSGRTGATAARTIVLVVLLVLDVAVEGYDISPGILLPLLGGILALLGLEASALLRGV
jgi:hypothetical protein